LMLQALATGTHLALVRKQFYRHTILNPKKLFIFKLLIKFTTIIALSFIKGFFSKKEHIQKRSPFLALFLF
jgi:hypothetical protein